MPDPTASSRFPLAALHTDHCPKDKLDDFVLPLLARTAAAHIILEVEIGAVGGEENGVEKAINDKLYSTVADGLATVEALGSVRTAATSRP